MNRDKVMTFLKKSLRFLPDKSYIKLYYRDVYKRQGDMSLVGTRPPTLDEWEKYEPCLLYTSRCV